VALPKKKRTRRADVDLRQPDEFISFTAKAWEWVGQNRRPFLVGIVAFALVALGVWGVREWQWHQAASRSAAFSRAVELMQTPLQTEEEDKAAEDEADEAAEVKKEEMEEKEEFATVVERAQAAASELAAIEGTAGIGALAQLGKATTRLDMGEVDQAIDGYRAYVDSGVPPSLRLFGLDGLVTALLDKGDLDGALKAAQEIQGLDGGAYADHGAWLSARILERKGDAKAAREAYGKLLEEHPESLLKASAEKRLALLGG